MGGEGTSPTEDTTVETVEVDDGHEVEDGHDVQDAPATREIESVEARDADQDEIPQGVQETPEPEGAESAAATSDDADAPDDTEVEESAPASAKKPRKARWRRKPGGKRGAGEETSPTDDTAAASDAAEQEPAQEQDVDQNAGTDFEGSDADADAEESAVEDADSDEPGVDEPELEEVDLDGSEPAPAKPSLMARWLLGGNNPDDVLGIQLIKAAHAKQAITMALAVAVAAVVSGRPAREAAVVLGTVLLGQGILGLHNDIVDRQRDHAHALTSKPLAMGRLSAETAWYAVITLFLALLPLSFLNSITAASFYLGSVVIGMVGNILFRTGFFSWWSWAASFALIPFFLSYGGWGGEDAGDPPQMLMVILAALLGIGVHFTRAAWGLVADHEDNWTYLPLKLGMKIGATRLLALSTTYTIAMVIAIAVVGTQVGLRAS